MQQYNDVQYYFRMFLKNSASFSNSSILTASLSLMSISYLRMVSMSFSLFLKASCSYAIFFWLALS